MTLACVESDLFPRVLAARETLRGYAHLTPIATSRTLNAAVGAEVFCKCENFQRVGAFKFRGAFNAVSRLTDAQKKAGVITFSSGNHAQAIALACQLLGVRATIVMPRDAPAAKREATEGYGATVVLCEPTNPSREKVAAELQNKHGYTLIPPFDHLDVIAGQGTLGMELVEQAPDLDAVFISVGGGGLISGVGTVLKALNPRIRVVGVWPENSPCMLKAMQAGRIVDVEERQTLSDGTAGAVEPGSVTLALCRDVIDETVTVSEAEIGRAMRMIADAEHWIVEGAAGVALAGLVKRAESFRGQKVAVVLCGRNIALEKFLYAIELAVEEG